MKRLILTPTIILLLVTIGLAQTTTGRLSGNISGPDGLLPGATVIVRDDQTRKELTTTSDSAGHFIFPQLEFGTYTLTVKATGFKTFVGTALKIDVGREYSRDVVLEIGELQESISVVAGADILTATTPQISNTVSPKQILELPMITRNPLTLVELQAGTVNGNTNAFQLSSVNGMRTTLTNITRDGINIQDIFIRANATDFAPGRPSVDDTGEFTVNTANTEADQGYGGAQVRLVTPRGARDFHGGIFEYNRNSYFAANNFFNNRSGVPRPFRNRNQFGGKISGPLPLSRFGEGGPSLIHGKAFFFSAYEGIRDPLSTRQTRVILLPSARNKTFQFTRATAGNVTAFCPSSAAGSLCTVPDILAFANSLGFAKIPATVDPLVQSRVLAPMPTAGNAAGGDGLNTAGFALNRRNDQTRNTSSNRVDFDLNPNNSISGIFNYNKETNLRPDADNTKFTVVPGVSQISENKQYTAAWRHNFGATIVNEVRGGRFQSFVPFTKTDDTPPFFFTTNAAGLIAPTANSTGFISDPENVFLSQGRRVWSWNLQDNVDWVKDKHAFKFGGQLQFFAANTYNDVGIVPTYSLAVGPATPQFTTTSGAFLPTGSGQASTISPNQLTNANNLLALLSGVVSAGAQNFNADSAGSPFQPVRRFQPFRYANHSLYFQDRWQVTPSLSLLLGVRYEVFPALTIANGVGLEPVIADVNNPLASILSTSGTYGFVGGNAGKKNAYYKTDWNNLAPVLGFAYSVGAEKGWKHLLFGDPGKSVIRGGYSHIYGNDSIVTSISNAAAGNVGLGTTASNAVNALTGTTALNDRLAGPLTNILPPSTFVPGRTYLFNNSAAVAGNFGTVFAIDPHIQIPQIRQYSFGLQREFGSTAVEARYVGTRSNSLARSQDFNQVDIFTGGFLADFNRARANRVLTGNPFCTTTGCQALSIFQNGAGSPGHLGVGTGGLALATFNANLDNGTPADLAISFITSGLNNHPTVANPTATPFVRLLRNPATGIANLFWNNGYYQYDSLQIEVRRRLSGGLYFQGNYTFSKNLTNAIGTGQTLVEPFLDNNNPQLDKTRWDTDITHVFNFNGIYDLPFGQGRPFLKANGWVDRIVGGWQLSSIINWSSGSPITLVDTRGTLNRTTRSARQTPVTNLTNDQIRALMGHFENSLGIFYINPAVINTTGRASEGFGSTPFPGQVFFNVAPGQTGNTARGVLDGPGYFNLDAALLKNFRFGESMRLQLRAEAFNLLNHVNFQPPTQFPSITSATFGQLTAAFPARQIQFAARFEF
ncbi:MAG TPA: carboxypeptidase-like regulatory domain-containing protein [Pyrinomonadaceae bacterium]|nr:carboxypeptidase-like regulatory domain-containing protein [Pyrinomonadaceae bacterium]